VLGRLGACDFVGENDKLALLSLAPPSPEFLHLFVGQANRADSFFST
jgi:hypothetical protein